MYNVLSNFNFLILFFLWLVGNRYPPQPGQYPPAQQGYPPQQQQQGCVACSMWCAWNTKSLDLRLHSTHNLISVYLYTLHLSFPWMGFSLPQKISSATRAVPSASARLPAARCAWIPSSSRGDTASPSWWHARVSAATSAPSICPDNNNDDNNCWCASSTDVPSLLRQRRV